MLVNLPTEAKSDGTRLCRTQRYIPISPMSTVRAVSIIMRMTAYIIRFILLGMISYRVGVNHSLFAVMQHSHTSKVTDMPELS